MGKNLVDASIHYPVYMGLGNHDISNAGGGFGDTADGSKALFYYVRARSATFHIDHNSCGCLFNIDPGCLDDGDQGGGLNYYWDWHGVHMVTLNAGDENWHYIPPNGMNGLTWLARDLQHHVGNNNRPAILFQHYNIKKLGGTEWATADYHNSQHHG